MPRDVAAVRFVGRLRELETLRSAFAEVEQGETAGVFVTGDSGVGKSRLLAVATADMVGSGALVLSGACLDIGDAAPLHPLRQALRRFEGLPGVAGTTPSRAVRQLLALLDGDADGSDGSGAVLERIARGLSAASQGRPLVIVVDDLQWADRTTRRLLLYLLAGLGGMRLLLLGGVRAEALHGAHPLRQMLLELRRLRSVRMLDLAPLSPAETEQLVTDVVGRALEYAEAELFWERSRGNPFLVEELARDARDGRVGLSDTLREIVLARVDALPADARAVVHAVAAGVGSVAHELLAEVVPLDADELITAARTAVEHRVLVVTEDGYRCHHRLIKEVLEPRLLPGERAHLHRRYAETLAAVTGRPGSHARLAHHWRLAGEPGRALAAAVAAAEDAERRYGFAEAYEQWTVALQIAAEARPTQLPDVDRTALRRRAAEVAHQSGEHESALRLLDEIAATDRTGATPCWLRTGRARYLAAAGRPADAEAEYELVLASADCTAQERATAAAHSAELLLALGRHADCGERARYALDLARAVDDGTSSVVVASAALGFSQAYLNDPVAGLAAVRQALRAAEQAASPADVGCAYVHLSELLTGPLNNLEEGIAEARRGARRAEELGLGRTFATRLLAIAANGLFRIGRWSEAEKDVAAGLRYRPSGAEAVELLLARCRIWIGYGDIDSAEQDLEAIVTLLVGGGPRHVLPLLTLQAGLAMWRGHHVDARRAVQRGLHSHAGRSDDVWLLAPLVWHGLRAEAEASVSGSAEPDPEAVAALCRFAERITLSSRTAAAPVRDAVTGYSELCAGEISRLENRSDAAAWGRAAQAWMRRDHPYPAAYAQLRQAEALFAHRTRNAEATGLLRTAFRTARRLGARPLAEEMQTLAARARVPLDEEPTAGQLPPPSGAGTRVAVPAPPGKPGRGDDLSVLTGRELQVLVGVAAGQTNREIGQRLFISERTVGVHVSRILNKLQLRSRVQASAVYQRSQWHLTGEAPSASGG
ncbi:MAG TPA: AAA family ATPase [Micromonosporaceae bacterium]|nr:AAA family ATPase [Micromonosporaceae bacterium]